VIERWGRQITGSCEVASSARHLAAGSQRWNRLSKGRFCVFRDGDACQTGGRAIEGLACFWSTGDKTTKSNNNKGSKGREDEEDI
jgi:hypothetical protein